MSSNLGASIAAKLKNHAREDGRDVMTLLRRYAQERLLYRLSVSPVAENFCLKGGLLLGAYNGGNLRRSTDDIDFNGFNENGTIDELHQALLTILSTKVEDDGVVFLGDTIRIAKDREGGVPGGKIVMQAMIHTARVDVRIDVGFGNVITPEARMMEIPTLLPGSAPKPVIAAYPLETVVAEKLHAMLQHGLANTRMKDYYDIWLISTTDEFEGETLSAAIRNTFRRHRRELSDQPAGLSQAMVELASNQWKVWTAKQRLEVTVDFEALVDRVRDFVLPAIIAAKNDSPAPERWMPNAGWSGPSLKL